MRNRVGNDITVYATGSYTLWAANQWGNLGTWFSLGTGNGQASFDLAAVSLDSARYLKIVSNGSSTLDAISYLGSPWTGVDQQSGSPYFAQLRIQPNPAAHQAVIGLSPPEFERAVLRIVDVSGRTVKTIQPGKSGKVVWNLGTGEGRPVPDGMYFCCLETPFSACCRKVVVQR